MPKDLIVVTEIAKDFLAKSGYPFSRLDKAEFDKGKNEWILTFDVGVAAKKLRNVIVDDAAGKVMSFEPAAV